ncbi:hypothetical protein [Agrobacterium tumefaciens]|uniref:hypothetical protein n=1 Tax=Agrobacterium tumefaciens TaxID=358 RepID=UPI003BA35E81
MAPTFPRELPDVVFTTADLTLDDGVTASATRGKLTNFTQVAEPSWSASFVTKPLRFSEKSSLETWWFSLRGGTRAKGVIFRHPRVCYPKAHWQNHAPAEDEGLLASVTDGNVLSVTGVSPGLVLGDTDLIGLEFLTRTYLGKVVEVSGAGTTRTITVEPPPYRAVAQAGAIVRFAKIPLIMRPVPGSFSASETNGRYVVSFKLQE